MHRLPFFALPSLVFLVPAILGSDGRVIPHSGRGEPGETRVDVEAYFYFRLRDNGMIRDRNLPFAMYVRKVQGRELANLVLKWKGASGEVEFVFKARTAELRYLAAERQLAIRLQQADFFGKDDSRGYFEDRVIVLDLPRDFDPR